MRMPGSARRLPTFWIAPLLCSVMAISLPGGPAARPAWAKVETWRQEGPSAFTRAHREGVVISDNGRVRLGHAVAPEGSLTAARVWDLSRMKDGTLLAATGDSGQVFRRASKPDGAWSVHYDAADSQVLAMVACPDGTVFAGTGPGGQVVDLSDAKHAASRPDPKVQYIWDLAADADGNLYAATGPAGQLWKRGRSGRWSLVYDSRSTHLLSVAVGRDGTVYAGGDGEGLIYRVGRDGKATILFDAPQADIRALLVADDGTLYAGTAAEAGGSGGSRNSLFLSLSGSSHSTDAGGADRPPAALTPRAAAPQPGSSGKPSRPSGGGSASPKPVTPGDNAVYRIEADGIPREVLRVKALIHALAFVGDRLWVGTGPEGQIYEVRGRGEESAPVAKLDNGQVLSLLAEPGGGLLIGAGDPGAVLRLSAHHAPVGRLVSEVHDTKLISRFGAMTWRAIRPPGTSIAVQARSGNVGEPDETWSDWSAEQSDPDTARVACPPGRFVQYRVKLATADPGRTPELRSVALSFRTSNLAPELTRVDVPDLSTGDGAVRQTRLNLRWEATDPNDDELNFHVYVRKEGWPDWVRLNEDPTTDKNYSWDTTAFPSGLYRVKVVATDRPSNSPDDALTRERESLNFLVDHEPPRVGLTPKDRGARIALADDLTRIAKAEYAVDGGPWTPIFPVDEIFDSTREEVVVSLPDLAAGHHILMVKATDAAGNVGTGDLLLSVGRRP